jgi:hypothetical protein
MVVEPWVPAFPHEAGSLASSGILLEFRQASMRLVNIAYLYTPHVLEFQNLNLPTFWVTQKGHCQRNWHRGLKLSRLTLPARLAPYTIQ